MKLPEYVTAAEVKRVCKEAGLRDWTKITEPVVSEEEAARLACSIENPESCEMCEDRKSVV